MRIHGLDARSDCPAGGARHIIVPWGRGTGESGMSMVRVAVFAVIAVAVGGAAYVYRDEVAQRLGLGASASAAEKGSSPAAMAQPQGRRGRANPAGAVPVVVTSVEPKAMP